jgi:GNAT superfamily N-acetyltransferase
MGLPSNWKSPNSSLDSADDTIGHQQRGATVAIHSVAVAKEHQGMGLGTVLMKAYIQRIKDSKCADNLALLAHDHLIGFYTGLGFTNAGPSSSKFGGGGWNR